MNLNDAPISTHQAARQGDKVAIAKLERIGAVLYTMGHVSRTDDGFEVTTNGRHRNTLRVWRDIEGKVRCSCAEFVAADDVRFRCEHIYSVKSYLDAVNGGTKPDGVVDDSEGDDAPRTATFPTPPDAEPIPVDVAEAEEHAPGAPPALGLDLAAFPDPLFSAFLATLSAPLPDELIKQRVGWKDRQGREHDVDYVEWHVVAAILDTVAPRWSHSVRNLVQIGGLVAVTASITIDGVTREGIGTGEAIDEKGIKKAEHDALKRAAVKFGLARHLYTKEDRQNVSAKVQNDPVARTLSDLVTPKQLVAIRAIASAVGIDAERACLERFNCRPEELAKRAASEFIDFLKGSRDASSRRAS